MRKYLFIIVILACSVQCHAITITKVRFADGSEKNDYLHKISNDFASGVGNALKQNFPSRVSEIGVGLTLEGGHVKITYMAKIVSCSTSEAMTHFDHRGALAIEKDKKRALNSANQRCSSQKEPTQRMFRKVYGGVMTVAAHGNPVYFKRNWWYVTENFFMAK